KPCDACGEATAPLVIAQHLVAKSGLLTDGVDRERPVFDVDHVGVALLSLDLQVGKRRLAAGTPVDDVVAAIDQPLLPEPNEHLADRRRESRVHREPPARPVAGGAAPSDLLDD